MVPDPQTLSRSGGDLAFSGFQPVDPARSGFQKEQTLLHAGGAGAAQGAPKEIGRFSSSWAIQPDQLRAGSHRN